jgi:hypothetical protein
MTTLRSACGLPPYHCSCCVATVRLHGRCGPQPDASCSGLWQRAAPATLSLQPEDRPPADAAWIDRAEPSSTYKQQRRCAIRQLRSRCTLDELTADNAFDLSYMPCMGGPNALLRYHSAQEPQLTCGEGCRSAERCNRL